MDDSSDSGNFSLRDYLSLVRKDSVTHMHGLAVYVKKDFLFHGTKTMQILTYVLIDSTSLSVLFLFLLSITLFVFDSILSNIDEILSINSSANVFVFGDLNVHNKCWLTYSGGTDRPSKLCYNFSISNDLTQMVNFVTRISVCDSHSPALLGLLISSDASICSGSPSIGKS